MGFKVIESYLRWPLGDMCQMSGGGATITDPMSAGWDKTEKNDSRNHEYFVKTQGGNRNHMWGVELLDI